MFVQPVRTGVVDQNLDIQQTRGISGPDRFVTLRRGCIRAIVGGVEANFAYFLFLFFIIDYP